VSKHGGAEIKSEGDSLYVVFPSASSAVLCALAIVESAAEETKARPERPMHVGIGVHAGEVVEHEDTFLGSAVNIAARVCALAAPGEVLATATVRGVTQGSIPVSFTPRGRKRLKGIAEPVELFAVTEPGKEIAKRAIPRRSVAAVGGALGVLVLIIGAYVSGMLGTQAGNGGQSAAPTLAAATAPPLVVGVLPIGEYGTRDFRPPFSVTVNEPDWQAYQVTPEAVGLLREQEPTGHLDIGKIRGVITEPCNALGQAVSAGETPEDLMDAVRGVLFLNPGPEREISVGDYEGKAMDIVIDQGAQAACGGLAGGDVAVFKIGSLNWGGSPSELLRLIAIDVNGETVSMLLSGDDPTGSVPSVEQFMNSAEQVVQSIRF